MKETDFLKELADCFLRLVKGEKYPDLEAIIVDIGGFSRRIFSSEHFFHQHATNIVRFLVDMLQIITDDDFRKCMHMFTEMIIDFAANDLAVFAFNAAHTKKHSNTFGNPDLIQFD